MLIHLHGCVLTVGHVYLFKFDVIAVHVASVPHYYGLLQDDYQPPR